MTEPRQLNPLNLLDAVEINNTLIGRVKMDGLSGQEVRAWLTSAQTIAAFAQKPTDKPETTKKK